MLNIREKIQICLLLGFGTNLIHSILEFLVSFALGEDVREI